MSGRVHKLSSTFVRLVVPRGRQGVTGFSLTKLPLREGQRICGSLKAKFIIVIATLILVLRGAVTVVVERHQRRAIFEQTQVRALALGASLAAVSEGYLVSYDFIGRVPQPCGQFHWPKNHVECPHLTML